MNIIPLLFGFLRILCSKLLRYKS